MKVLKYYQYAFARSDCRVREIGSGIDRRFQVELVCDGPIAAVVSRIGLDEFDPDRLHGRTPEDVRWTSEMTARHNAIICRAAGSSVVLPLPVGTVLRSHDSLCRVLKRSQSVVTAFLDQFSDRQEWGVRLYLQMPQMEATSGHSRLRPPHYVLNSRRACKRSCAGNELQAVHQASVSTLPQPHPETACMTQKEAPRELCPSDAVVAQAIQAVERQLTENAERCCRIDTLPDDPAGQSDDLVFDAAFLLPSAAQENWLKTLEDVWQDTSREGLLLEVSGPWPPYHFCPTLEM